MRRWTIFAGLAALSSATLLGSLAPGAEHPRVLILGPSEDDPIVERLTEELRILGLEVVFAAGNRRGPGRLSDLAHERHADAAARVEDHPHAVVLWVDPARSPPAEGAGDVELRFDEAMTGSKDAGLLALRAIEVLRGRLLPVEHVPPTDASRDAGDAFPEAGERGDSGAPSEVRTPSSQALGPGAAPVPHDAEGMRAAPVARSAFSAFAGPSIALSPGGVPPSLDVALGARWTPERHLELELTGILPVTTPSVDSAEGTIDLRAYVVAGGVGAAIASASPRVFGSASLGLGAMRLVSHGSAAPPFRSADSSGWAALPYARIGAGYALSLSLALRADALLGVALPRPVLRMDGDRVAAFGEPFALLGVFVEVRP